MRIVPKLADRRAAPKSLRPAVILTNDQEALIARYAAPVRRELRRLIRSSERLAELASVFPGAVHALATRRGPPAARLQALSLIEQGAPLKVVVTHIKPRADWAANVVEGGAGAAG